MSNGAHVINSTLKNYLPSTFPIKKYIGLVETSIGKMVPLQENSNFLKVISEENNDVIVDKHGFIGPIPTSKYIVPVTPIKAYVERNFTSTTLAMHLVLTLDLIIINRQPILMRCWQILPSLQK